MKKNSCKTAGFTLVELIVVIAVIGVLAAILIPSMMGYTRKAKFAAVNSNAKSLLNAGMLACRENEVTKPIPPGIYIKTGCNTFGATDAKEDPVISKYVQTYFQQAEANIWALQVRDDYVVGACLTNGPDSMYVGTYPHPNRESKSLNESSFDEMLHFAETGSWD